MKAPITIENSDRAENGEPQRAASHQAAGVEHIAADDREFAMREVHHAAGFVENDDAGSEQRVGAGQDDDGRNEFHGRAAFSKSRRRGSPSARANFKRRKAYL